MFKEFSELDCNRVFIGVFRVIVILCASLMFTACSGVSLLGVGGDKQQQHCFGSDVGGGNNDSVPVSSAVPALL